MARRFERLLVAPLVLALAGLAGAQAQPVLHTSGDRCSSEPAAG